MLYIPLTTFSCAHMSVVERGVATAEKGNAITHSVCLFAVTRHSLYPSLPRSLARSLSSFRARYFLSLLASIPPLSPAPGLTQRKRENQVYRSVLYRTTHSLQSTPSTSAPSGNESELKKVKEEEEGKKKSISATRLKRRDSTSLAILARDAFF